MWTIDPGLFGAAARLEWQQRAYAFDIHLTDAILPGTNLRTDFEAVLSEAFSGWQIALRHPRLGFSDLTSLAEWIRGMVSLRDYLRIPGIELGGGTASFATDRVLVSLDHLGGFRFGAESDDVKVTFDASFTGSQLLLRPQRATGDSLLAALENQESGVGTSFSLVDPRRSGMVSLGPGGGRKRFGFQPELITEFSGEAYNSPSGAHGVTLVCGEGSFGRVCEKTNLLLGDRVQLEHAALLKSSGQRLYQAAVAGRVSRVAHRVEFGSWGATVGGNDEEPIYARFGEGEQDVVRINANLHSVSLPIEDADSAQIDIPAQAVALIMDGGPPQQRAKTFVKASKAQKEFGGSVILTGDNPVALLHLEDAKLTVRRSVDLLNLTFSFEGFDMRIRRGVPTLRMRRSKVKGQQWEPANLAVHFPPQHIAERWFSYQDPTTIPPNTPTVKPEAQRFSDVEAARLSGESRIVFRVQEEKRKRPKWVERPITVQALTDWSDLAINVNERALGANKSIEDQIGVSHIKPATSFADAIKQAEASLQQPRPRETALEMSGRLIFSPSDEATWTCPRGHVNVNNAVLWHAKLDQIGRKTVRALWSEWMTPGQFMRHQQSKDSKAPADERLGLTLDPLLVLSPDNHWNIVAQTSLYGLIALRGTEDDLEKPPESGLTALVTGVKQWFSPSSKNEPKRIPRNRVVTPKQRYESLEYLKQDKAKRSPADNDLGTYAGDAIGFALVEPFDDANIILTSLGGSLAAEWNGEPFATPVFDPRLPPTFNLERFIYRSQLGRDIHVETYDKGYLLPLGIRASYVELSERRFFAHPKYGYPVAYLVKRTFIVIRRPEKRLPAVDQQYDSRDFPAGRILMLTKTTPDLRSPKDSSASKFMTWKTSSGNEVKIYSNGRLRFAELQEDDLVFWPRMTEGSPGTPGDVEFKWTLDDDHTPSASNLLFISNSCSHNPNAMRVIAEYYRDLGKPGADTSGGEWSPLRKARLFGTRRRYAATKPDAETAFDTDSWLLSLRGPADLSGNKESFVISQAMERADQPPFFPLVEKARIAVQSLDRLLGSPQGLLEVQFYRPYVATEFKENKAEIFLEVLHPLIRLNVNNQASATGGLGRTNAALAALSRLTGFVGGQPGAVVSAAATNVGNVQLAGLQLFAQANLAAVVNPPSQPAALIGPPSHPSNFTFSSAEGNQPKFNPLQFFDESATLLGLITLHDLFSVLPLPAIDQAPKLLESIGYSPSNLASNLNSLTAPFKTLADLLTAIGPKIDGLLPVEVGGSNTTKLSFESLYPTLAHAIADLATLLRGKLSLTDLGNILSQGQRVLSELQRVLQDPVPEMARRELTVLAADWDSLKNAANGVQSKISGLGTLADRFFQTIISRATTLDLCSVLLGRDFTATDDVSSVLSGVENSLFTSMLALPLAAANRSILDLQSAAPRSLDQVAKAIQGSLDAFTITLEFAQVAEAGSALASWAQMPLTPDHARVVRFAYEIAGGRGLPPRGPDKSSFRFSREDLADTGQAFRQVVNKLAIVTQGRQDLVERLNQARSDFLNASDRLATTVDSLCLQLFGGIVNGRFPTSGGLEEWRAWVEGAKHVNLNIDLVRIEKAVAEVIRLRQLAARQAQALAPLVKVLDDIIRADPNQSQRDQIQILCSRLTTILLAVTGMDRPETGPALSRVVTADMEFLRSKLDKFPLFDRGITDSLAWAQDTAPRLREKLLNLRPGVDSLVQMAEDSRSYLERAAKQLAGLGLQTVALPITDARILMLSSARFITQSASRCRDLYGDAATAVDRINDAIKKSALGPLINPKITTHIDQIRTDLNSQAEALKNIATQVPFSRAVGTAVKLSDSVTLTTPENDLSTLESKDWATIDLSLKKKILKRLDDDGAALSESIAEMRKAVSSFVENIAGDSNATLVRSLAVLDDVMSNALQESVSGLIDGTVRAAIADATSQLKTVLAQILPTRTDLAYHWDSPIPPYPGAAFSFQMEPPEQGKPDFSVDTNIKINFLTGERDFTSASRLGPFQITLLKDLVTIRFHEAQFTSANGSEPKLTVKFNEVVLGPGLNFLKALQSLLSPQDGNGPYLTLTQAILAVGYRYDAGLIQVGNLQFIHVSLHVYTKLPLRELADGDLAAQIGFGFASEERPFLIAAPPYGGGGYVLLSFEKKRLRPRISLSFGAVVAIQFGPLSGHGRVTSTITWGDVIRASVEAVGEGHLGCFGVAVMLQIALEQRPADSDNLEGSAFYSFEFTVGFLSLSFSFSAHYTLHGGNGQQPQRAGTSSSTKVARLYQQSDGARTILVSDSSDSDQNYGPLLIQNKSVTPEEAARQLACQVAADPSTRRIKVVAPQKSTAWRAYRDRLSMSLLED
jgi:hypothetical protein